MSAIYANLREHFESFNEFNSISPGGIPSRSTYDNNCMKILDIVEEYPDQVSQFREYLKEGYETIVGGGDPSDELMSIVCSTFIHYDPTTSQYVLTKNGEFDSHSCLEKYNWLESIKADTSYRTLEEDFYRYDECIEFRREHGEDGFRTNLVSYILVILNKYADSVDGEEPAKVPDFLPDYLVPIFRRAYRKKDVCPLMKRLVFAFGQRWFDVDCVGEPYYGFFYTLFEQLYLRCTDRKQACKMVNQLKDDVSKIVLPEGHEELSDDSKFIITLFLGVYVKNLRNNTDIRKKLIRLFGRRWNTGIPINILGGRPGRYMPVRVFFRIYNSMIRFNC